MTRRALDDRQWSQVEKFLRGERRAERPGKNNTPRRKRGAAAQGIGRSRGGPSTKVHLLVDALGLPLTFDISEGQRHDSKPAKELVLRVLSRWLWLGISPHASQL